VVPPNQKLYPNRDPQAYKYAYFKYFYYLCTLSIDLRIVGLSFCENIETERKNETIRRTNSLFSLGRGTFTAILFGLFNYLIIQIPSTY